MGSSPSPMLRDSARGAIPKPTAGLSGKNRKTSCESPSHAVWVISCPFITPYKDLACTHKIRTVKISGKKLEKSVFPPGSPPKHLQK